MFSCAYLLTSCVFYCVFLHSKTFVLDFINGKVQDYVCIGEGGTAGSAFRDTYKGKFGSIIFDPPWSIIPNRVEDIPIPWAELKPIAAGFVPLLEPSEGKVGVRLYANDPRTIASWYEALRGAGFKNVATIHIVHDKAWINSKTAMKAMLPTLTNTAHVVVVGSLAPRFAFAKKKAFGIQLHLRLRVCVCVFVCARVIVFIYLLSSYASVVLLCMLCCTSSQTRQ